MMKKQSKKGKQTKQKSDSLPLQKSVIPKSLSENKTKEGTVCTNIIITAHPNSKSNAILEVSEESVSVHIAAPPTDGEANSLFFLIIIYLEELIDYLRDVFNVKKQQIELQRGGKSHYKIVTVIGLNQETVYNILQEEIKKN